MKLTDRETKILFMLVQGMTKKELIDAIASGSKLTKADAGRVIGTLPKREFEDFLLGMDKAQLIDAIKESAKLTKADAGRALDAAIEAIYKRLKTVYNSSGL